MKRCERHGLATSPDGRCVLCERELKAAGEAALIRKKDRIPRAIAKVLVGIVACVATLAMLMMWLDTQNTDDVPEADAGADAHR